MKLPKKETFSQRILADAAKAKAEFLAKPRAKIVASQLSPEKYTQFARIVKANSLKIAEVIRALVFNFINENDKGVQHDKSQDEKHP